MMPDPPLGTLPKEVETTVDSTTVVYSVLPRYVPLGAHDDLSPSWRELAQVVGKTLAAEGPVKKAYA